MNEEYSDEDVRKMAAESEEYSDDDVARMAASPQTSAQPVENTPSPGVKAAVEKAKPTFADKAGEFVDDAANYYTLGGYGSVKARLTGNDNDVIKADANAENRHRAFTEGITLGAAPMGEAMLGNVVRHVKARINGQQTPTAYQDYQHEEEVKREYREGIKANPGTNAVGSATAAIPAILSGTGWAPAIARTVTAGVTGAEAAMNRDQNPLVMGGLNASLQGLGEGAGAVAGALTRSAGNDVKAAAAGNVGNLKGQYQSARSKAMDDLERLAEPQVSGSNYPVVVPPPKLRGAAPTNGRGTPPTAPPNAQQARFDALQQDSFHAGMAGRAPDARMDIMEKLKPQILEAQALADAPSASAAAAAKKDIWDAIKAWVVKKVTPEDPLVRAGLKKVGKVAPDLVKFVTQPGVVQGAEALSNAKLMKDEDYRIEKRKDAGLDD